MALYNGRLTLQEHIRRGGGALHYFLDRCGNRYHVVQTHHHRGTSQSEVQQLFMKMQRVTEATGRPARGYMHRGVGRRPERSMLGNQEHIEMRRRPNLTTGFDLGDGGADLRQWRSAAPRQLPTVFSSRQSISKPPLSIILLGRRKSGKSSVGNQILGKKEFKTDTKTSQNAMGQRLLCGTSVTVVDTPGWSLYGQAKSEKVKLEISESPSLRSLGSKCVFLLVLPVDSFTEKHRAKVEKYLGVLGDDIWGKTLVLFTFGDELKGKSIEEYITKQGQALQWVMQRCGHRHHVTETSERHENQREQLMEKIWGINENN
ncbi:GTPase IMAP family member 6-like [Periophthalmus magnuspinnatus]|uniref:GTPase IMAP family member 6-like n=1 Tax=Periophthalmus magnuspinnatus TaxID=409849 RepID=UPI00145B3091|nr:GTPase IMAP family member 6-like [Periophthalmus magnuspinnatus]